MNIHSIRIIPEPPEPESEPDDEEDEERENPALIGSDAAGEKEDENATSSEKPAVSIEKKDPKDYVELDVTITPKPASCNAFTFWEPTEFILASDKIKSLGDLEEKTIGDVHSVEIWNGSAFGPDEQGKYPGEQRLKIIFEVKPGSKSGWLCYYHEAIGQLQLPVGTVEV